ncbi:hypothetical protein NFI96_014500 [Prochilodus magdalenae]|nr:hypothetical protein NFI96_014500 [Prochilodus magdalenae]
MALQAGLWLFLLLPVTVVTGPLTTPEGKPDQSQDLTPLPPWPERSGGELESESTAPLPKGETSGSILTSSDHLSGHVPCVEEQPQSQDALSDFLLALRESWESQSELGKEELARFGICSHSDGVPLQQFSSLVTQAQKAHKKNTGPGYFHTKREHWDVEENGKFTLTLHLTRLCKHYQQSTVASIMLLFFVDTINTEGLNIKFSSHALQPNKQTVCVSKGTQFVVLPTGHAEIFGHGHLKLRIAVGSQEDGEQKMGLADFQGIMAKKDAKTSIPLSPVVVFFTHESTSELQTPPSNRTFFFLCELQKFLSQVLPLKDLGSSVQEDAPVSESVLHSLPPLTLGVSSSESVLLELINSSGPTVFSFPRDCLVLQKHQVELDLNPELLSVLRLRLHEALAQIRTEEAGHSVMVDKLQVLTALTALPGHGEGAETGLENLREVQYRAFLLLKALQTVLGTWAVERAQRTARADQITPTSQCGLQSLTVSLEKYVLHPPIANINNCEGPCHFPPNISNNHALLLSRHRLSGQPLTRTLCCVPVDYDNLCVIEVGFEGAIISYKTNMIAKKCECR